MSIVVTGGAGFIGSCVVRTLNDLGIEDIIIVDDIACTEKWKNLRNKKYIEYIHKSKFLQELCKIKGIQAIIHLGAQSATTEKDFDYLWNNNFEYSKVLWHYCSEKRIQFIYASSASTYGNGENGFDDKIEIDLLRPLNGYGYSKQLFDLWIKKQAKKFPKQYVGLKFFNVYGPNEYFKNSMASMVYHGYNQIKQKGSINLFKSYNINYSNGEQLRDFIYVKDICDVIVWFLLESKASGLYNVGTGNCYSFNELADSIFTTLKIEKKINYIDMPLDIRGNYQYFTQADLSKLRGIGYKKQFKGLAEGVFDYITNYLEKNTEIY